MLLLDRHVSLCDTVQHDPVNVWCPGYKRLLAKSNHEHIYLRNNTFWKVREGKKGRSSARSYSRGAPSAVFSGLILSLESLIYHDVGLQVSRNNSWDVPKKMRSVYEGSLSKTKVGWLLRRKVDG